MAAISNKVLELYPSQVRARKNFNVRKDMGNVADLKKSIAANGIRIPLLVIKTKDKTDDGYPIYELVDGHRRFTAAFALSINKPEDEAVMIPAQEIDKNATEQELVSEMLVRGIDQKSLNLVEQAKAIKRLLDAEPLEGEKPLREADVARMIGKSHTYVSDCLLLLKATKETIKQIEEGAVSATAIIEMLRANPDSDEVEDMVTTTKETTGKKKVTVKDVEKVTGKKATKKSSGGSSTSTKKGADEVTSKKKADTLYGKNDNAVAELEGFLESLQAQTEEKAKDDAMAALEGVILLLKGKKEPFELLHLFLEVKQAKKATAPKKSASKLPQDEVEEEVVAPKKKTLKDVMSEEDEEEAPVKKSSKKSAPAKKAAPAKPVAKKKVVEELDDEDELIDDEDLLDDTDLDDDDDII